MNFFKSNIEKIKDYDWKKLIDLGTFLFLSLFEIEKTISISSKLESLINNEEDKAFFKRFISANVLAFERLSEKEIYSLSYKVINEEFEVLDSHELDDFLKALYPLKKELIDKATYHGFLNLLHFYLKNKKKNQLNIIEENLSDDEFISRLSWLDSYKMFDKIIFESYAHFMDESFNFSSRKVFSILNSLNSELPIRFDIFKKAASLNPSWYSYIKKISLTQVENLNSVGDEIFNYSKWTIYLEKNIEEILKIASMYSCLDLQNRFRINKDSASILILLGEKVFNEIINYQINDTYLSLLKFYLVDLGNEIALDKNGLIESILKDESFSKSLESLSISKDFLFDNKDEFSKLLVKDMAKIINTFAKDYSSSKKVAFSKILKAQIAGKFDELKFYKGDLAKEIGKDISEEQELIWKENKQLRMKNIEIKETYDFLTTINIGVYPTKTCMHYEHGAHRRSLLSNFDSNKKIMTAYKDGKLVARAILRLTTGSKDSINQDLEFVDVTTENANSKTKENLLLFLERGYYSNINEEEKDLIFKKFVELSYLKAKEIGAKFSGADCYNSFLLKYPIYHKGYFYVTITKSKNETQYLDSFGGESVASELTQARSDLIILE